MENPQATDPAQPNTVVLQSGQRVVLDSDWTRAKSAANDLSKLKGSIPEGIKVEDLPRVFEEYARLKAAAAPPAPPTSAPAAAPPSGQPDPTALQQALDQRDSDLAKLKAQNKALAEGVKRGQIDAAVYREVQDQISTTGDYLATEFIDKEILYKLDPGSPMFTDDLREVLKGAYARQQQVLQGLPRVPQNISPATNPMGATPPPSAPGQPGAGFQPGNVNVVQSGQRVGRVMPGQQQPMTRQQAQAAAQQIVMERSTLSVGRAAPPPQQPADRRQR